jgi:hypothetical protein
MEFWGAKPPKTKSKSGRPPVNYYLTRLGFYYCCLSSHKPRAKAISRQFAETYEIVTDFVKLTMARMENNQFVNSVTNREIILKEVNRLMEIEKSKFNKQKEKLMRENKALKEALKSKIYY